jgi:uncharacterized protein
VEILQQVGLWSWFFLWSFLLVVASLFVYLGLGGNFIILAMAAIHGLVTGFDPLTWKFLLLLLGMVLLGELIEFVVGTFYVAKKGASKAGVIGAFAGGLFFASVGNQVFPILGAVVGSFLGAFSGAVAGEYWREKNLEPSLRIGAHAFMGRMVAILIKHFIAIVMIFMILKRTIPET